MVSDISGWPGLQYEEKEWQSSTERIPRKIQLLQNKPYLAAITPLISEIKKLPISPDLIALSDASSSAIARFDAEFGNDLTPFTALLLSVGIGSIFKN